MGAVFTGRAHHYPGAPRQSPYHHRLMDYNNEKTTILADVQSLFREALKDMNDSAWLTAHGFAPTVKY
jgi:hypothetical protein